MCFFDVIGLHVLRTACKVFMA